MAISAQKLADLMPDTSQLESNEPEMESSLHYSLGLFGKKADAIQILLLSYCLTPQQRQIKI